MIGQSAMTRTGSGHYVRQALLTAMVIFALVARAFGSRKLVQDLITGLILGSLAWLLFDRLGLQLGQFLPIAGI